MSDSQGSKNQAGRTQSGNAALIALAVVAVVALAGVAYFSGALPIGANKTQPSVQQTADATTAPAAAAQAPAAGEAAVIKPGNPVVAKVNGEDVMRNDVLGFIQTLPPQTRQLPLDQLFPLAVNQVVNAKIINEKTKDVKLDSDPEVQKQLELAKQQIVRSVWLQKMVDSKISEDRLKADYDKYLGAFQKVQEVKAQHILVADEAKAKDLIKQLDGGADFATLAKENSTDATAQNGGELGYFAEAEVVPEFGKAAFGTAPGSYTKEPIKTQFGYHILKVEEKRERPPATYEMAKPFLEAQARREVLDGILTQWQNEGKIQRFDINGDPMKIEPAAGTPAQAPTPAPAQ